MRTALPLLLCLALAPVWGQVKPVLSLGFDGDFNAVAAAGPVAPTVEGKPELVPGKIGGGLKVGPKLGCLDFPSTYLNPQSGTVEMWVQAVDWQADDGKFHVFFDVRGQGALYLYKYFNSKKLLMLTCADVQGPYASAAMDTGFQPGAWHHLAGTWSPDGVMVYYDGKPAADRPVTGHLPKSFGPTFRLGDQPWQFPRETASVIDQVRVYDRALTPAHIAAHAAGNEAFTVPLAASSARLDYQIDPDTATAELRLDLGGADVDDGRVKVKLGVVATGGTLAADAVERPIAGGRAAAAMPLPARTPGRYDIVATVLCDGRKAFDLRDELIIPNSDWWGNRIGAEDQVLPPWTPLKTSGTTVNCWGREYRFDGAPLPTQVVTAGAPVLARPMAWKLTGGGREATWDQASVRRLESSDTRATLAGSATAHLGDETRVFRTRITAEYDGLVLCEVSCAGPETLTADGLSLEIPVKPANALYRHRYSSSWNSVAVTGNVPAEAGVVDKTAFVPFAWLGDNDRGLFWFCESDQMWPNSKAENALELVREAEAVTIRLNLLATGQKLPADWKFVFGLQATPVKPIPKDWRKWRLRGGGSSAVGANVEILWPSPKGKDSLRAFGWPEAADPKTFQARIDDLHDKGLKIVPYLCLTFMTGDVPEWRYYRKWWEMGPADPSIPEAGWHHAFHQVSPVGKGYADYVMDKTKRFLEQYGIDGVYHDQTHPYTSNAIDSGVGYLKDGQAYRTYPILGYRALYRRNYALVKSLPRETFTMAHMSGKVTIPILAYDDSYLDGEHFRGVVKDSYLDIMPLDYFRAEFIGRQWGLMPFFLPEFDAEHSKLVEPTRGMMGLLMIHDVSLWNIWCNPEVVNEAYRALDEFGYQDSEFLPYFDPRPPARTELKDVYASAYRRADGKALLVIANLGKADRQGTVTIDAKRLGLPLTKVISWPDKTPLAVKDGRLDLPIPRLGYRMVVVER